MIPTTFHHAGLDWIPHTPGDPMPCPGDTLVRVLFQAEQTHKTEYRPRSDMAKAYWWDDCRESSIIGWHPIEEQPDPAETHRRAIEWHGLTDADLRLRLGELNAQEIRTVRAVLNAIVGKSYDQHA